MRFTPCKAEQVKSNFISDIRIHNDKKIQFSIIQISIEIKTTWNSWSYKEKKYKKITAYRKCVQKEPTVKRCLLILDVKPVRS